MKIRGHGNNMIPCTLTGQLYTNGDTTAELRTYKYKDITSDNCKASFLLRYSYANNAGVVYFSNISSIVPTITNTTILGSPSRQWKDTYTRHILIDNDINIASSLINKTSTSGTLVISSGANYTDGASIGMYGKDYNSGMAGCFSLYAYGNYDYTYILIYPNGTMSVYNNSTNTTKNIAMQEDVIPRSGGAVMSGVDLARTVDDNLFKICGGTGYGKGGVVAVYGKDVSVLTGTVVLQPALSTSQFVNMILYPDGTWTWAGTAVQLISDQRLKQQITEIDDKLLDAWEDVDLVQFKYNDAVDQKGDNARLHTGYVVQQIDEACKSHNVDISEYGLYCHEEYPEETEEVEVTQDDGTTTKETKVIREASEHYSLRYTEVYAVECAYLRREVSKLKQQNDNLEQRLKMLEQYVK